MYIKCKKTMTIMFFHIIYVYCGSTFDFLEVLRLINNIDYNAKKQNRCMQEPDCYDLAAYDVKYVFASEKSAILYLARYDLVIKRAILVNHNNQEGEIAVSVNHDNIVTTYITFRQRYNETTLQWLVMEHLNYDLSRISNMDSLSKTIIRNSVCDALIYLHSCNIAHLDVKPANVGATIMYHSDNNKKKDGLLHIYKTLNKVMFNKTDFEYFYDLMINHKYIKTSQDSATRQSLLNAISCIRKQKNDTKPSITISQVNNEGYGVVYKLLDFGLSCRYNENETNNLLFNLYGTYPDIAYEIYKYKTFTLKTDVFNFGSFCFRLFYNNNLNRKGKNGSIVDYETNIQQKNKIKLKNSNTLINEIILSCISNDPLERCDMTIIKQKLQTYEKQQIYNLYCNTKQNNK